MRMSLQNVTTTDVSVNFALAYQLNLSLSAWAPPETYAVTSGDLQVVHGDDQTVLLLKPELSVPSGSDFLAADVKMFAITLAAGQGTTLEMTSFLGGEASAVPEPSSLGFLGVACLMLQSRSRRRPSRATSLEL